MAGLEPDVRVFKDPEALSHAAASLLVSIAAQTLQERNRFLLCLSGGSTPGQLLSLLAQSPYREQLDWQRIHVFWGDERCVPSEDLNSNYRMARELLLSAVPVPQENIHRVRTELEPELAAEDYELTIRRFAEAPLAWPRFDFVLLGLGSDGHTASLFPGSTIETRRAVLAVTAPEGASARQRVTLTPPVFNSARCIVFLVQGEGKSKIVASVLYGAQRPRDLPPQQIHPDDGTVIWMLDAGAAAQP